MDVSALAVLGEAFPRLERLINGALTVRASPYQPLPAWAPLPCLREVRPLLPQRLGPPVRLSARLSACPPA